MCVQDTLLVRKLVKYKINGSTVRGNFFFTNKSLRVKGVHKDLTRREIENFSMKPYRIMPLLQRKYPVQRVWHGWKPKVGSSATSPTAPRGMSTSKIFNFTRPCGLVYGIKLGQESIQLSKSLWRGFLQEPTPQIFFESHPDGAGSQGLRALCKSLTSKKI